MTALFGQKWTKTYGLADRNGEWLKTLNGLLPVQLDMGLNRVRTSGSEWPPTAPEFRKLCQPTPEEVGLPPMAKAWDEANQHCGVPDSHPWTHRAVYLAGKAAGWHELRTQLTAQERRDVKVKFANAYQQLADKVCRGEPLEDQLAIEYRFDPSIPSEKAQRDTMAEQGIDPLDGAAARARLLGSLRGKQG